MEPVTISVISTYVAMKMVDQFLADQGYGSLKKLFFPKKEYRSLLFTLIEEVIAEHQKKYSYDESTGQFPFYHSQVLFTYLNQHILFKSERSVDDLQLEFKKNPNILPPNKNELIDFYRSFYTKISNSKELKRLHIEENYKDKIFEIGDSLFKIRLLLESIDNKLTFSLDSNWLDQKSRSAISDLGKRYTPELNFKLDVAQIFEGIGRTEIFSKWVFEHFDIVLIKGNKLRVDESLKLYIEPIKDSLKNLRELFELTDFTSHINIPIEQFQELLNHCCSTVSEVEDYLWNLRSKCEEDKDLDKFDNKFSSSLRELREFRYECSSFINFLNSTAVKLANNPYLLLEGEAGIGKSHLLADIVNTRLENDIGTVFILGQQLVTNEAPWGQIFKLLQLNSTSEDFLRKLNLYGKESEKRVIIFVDAINEGKGNQFWSNFINSFIDEIKQYEWLGLVLSIRSTYKELTLLPEQITRNDFIEYKHLGFQNVEYDAVNLFFDNYKIARPVVPLLNPEFKNPLFLKLFCEGINNRGLKEIPTGLKGISSILEFYINSVNLKLSSESVYGYSSSVNLVKLSIDALIKHKSDYQDKYLPYLKAFQIIEDTVSPYLNKKGFIDDLIKEGVLSKSPFWNEHNEGIDCIYLAFERFDDHLTASFLLETVSDIEYEFSDQGKLYEYVESVHTLNLNQGLIEALAIQVPEKFDRELYELLPQYEKNRSFIEAFIRSLVWRKIETIDHQKIKPYLVNSVFKYQGAYDFFFETIVSLSAADGHPYNANFLHKILKNKTLPDRDKLWTILLRDKYSEESSFRYLIDWAWSDNDKSHISNDSIKLASITLVWFLTSSNRELRDCTTKALVKLLENRIDVLIELIEEFDNVDDPFVIERIYAIAYGCALRTKQVNSLKVLAHTVYETIFNKEEVYPHILLRDYARGIIEYTVYLGNDLNIDINKTIAPYNSSWPNCIPSEADLKSKYDKDSYSHLWSSVMSYGDFARYTIGTNHNRSDWSGCKIGEVPINRKKIYEEFLTTLSSSKRKLFDALDPIITEGSEKKLKASNFKINYGVVVGRKKEEELKANNVVFKSSLENEELKYFETEIEPYLDHNHKLNDTDSHFDLRIAQRFIFERVIDLGWSPEKHLDFDKSVGTGRGRNESNQERIGKKYQWIAYYEFMARLADNFIRYEGYGDERKENPYIGPWDPYVRDIDPTILIQKTGIKKLKQSNCWWASKEVFDWNCSFDEWVSDHKTLDKPEELMEVVDSTGEEWLVLQSYPAWKEPKKIGNEEWAYPRKEVWCHVLSYLVKEDDYDEFIKWVSSQHFMGRWMPEGSDRYQLFDREFCWSQAFRCFQSDYYGGSEWVDVHDKDSREFIAQVSVNSINYHWEEEFDRSKVETLSFLKPSSMIIDKMNLVPGDEVGSLIDESGEKICFAAEAVYATKAHLLIKKGAFIKFLEDNKLKVVWTLLGEKGVIGGGISSAKTYSRVEFSGAFHLESGRVIGKNKIYNNR
ncbi:AVAST type 2 anti-phage system protein Avs2 [Thalassotalea fonticola]|uniref:AVAST type 2 anti-phage system protein Avs2 n=1 Tax=Thalassotalea fonticola TaxID=3065649 RepID=A0ABZ0GTX2_9GAMM|nr:AVAST type 2 anti-phage system protein Avs2 [Colwelliaceae bacterium S1-1]